jgi:hypothetical protein
MYTEIDRCRVCGNSNLQSVVHLGEQALTGVFPRSKDRYITKGPLELVKCVETSRLHCGLLQMRQTYNHDEMYGMNYGYRSGLNSSMVDHLRSLVQLIVKTVPIASSDVILDIGSNDGTLLRQYPATGATLIGIDPTGSKFKEYYPDNVRLIPDFFSAELYRREMGSRKAKIVTSIAMFYDLDAPLQFMEQVRDILADDGVWIFEQSYMPTMLAVNAYDTICHEHLEYYGLSQIQWMAERVGMRLIDVQFNSTNGGSFVVTAMKSAAVHHETPAAVRAVLKQEQEAGLHQAEPYRNFKARIFSHRDRLRSTLETLKREGASVLGYGASTKGNVLLQFCGINESDLRFIAEVNPDKYGSYTPGTLIPIISEVEAKALRPDVFLVLPWHFEENLVNREREYLAQGGKLLFPLPEIHFVDKNSRR